MSAGQYNTVCEQGATYSRVLTWRDSSSVLVNLTGYTAEMDVRTSSRDLVVTLTTANGRISLGGSAGTITLTLSATETAALAPGCYLYDLLLTSGGGVVTRLVEGAFEISGRVSV